MYNRDIYNLVLGNNKQKNNTSKTDTLHTNKRYNGRVKQHTHDNTISYDVLNKMFPNFELQLLMKKISKTYLYKTTNTIPNTNKYQYIRTIPYGTRGFVWIKQYYGYVYTYFVTYKHKSYQFNTIKLNIPQTKLKLLANGNTGTILYGCNTDTYLNNKKISYFILEHICFFQSENLLNRYSFTSNMKKQYYFVSNYVDINKKNMNDDMLSKYRFICLSNTYITQKKTISPIILIQRILKQQNKVFTIQLYNEYEMIYENRNVQKHIDTLKTSSNCTQQQVSFIVKPLCNEDIYSLYDIKTNEYVGNAIIQTIKVSKFMNKLFRNIPENDNLDMIEESDDEEYFENTNTDKDIIVKSMELPFIYNNRLKGWEPYMIKRNV